MADDPSLRILFDACPVGLWPAAAILTVLGMIAEPSGRYRDLLAAGLTALLAGLGKLVVSAVASAACACAVVGLGLIAALLLGFILLVVLAWRRDD